MERTGQPKDLQAPTDGVSSNFTIENGRKVFLLKMHFGLNYKKCLSAAAGTCRQTASSSFLLGNPAGL
jgi:hypothetical protein